MSIRQHTDTEEQDRGKTHRLHTVCCDSEPNTPIYKWIHFLSGGVRIWLSAVDSRESLGCNRAGYHLVLP